MKTGFLKQMLYEALFVPPNRAPFLYDIIDQPELSKYIKNWGQLPDDLAIICASEGELIGAV